jgi:hypothetical protein
VWGIDSFGAWRMLRLRVGWDKLRFALQVPIGLKKFLTILAVAIAMIVAVRASWNDKSSTQLSRPNVLANGIKETPEDYRGVRPLPTDRIAMPNPNNNALAPDPGYYRKRYRVIGDGEEGEYFYRWARCPAVPTGTTALARKIARVCAMPQPDRYKNPIDAIDRGSTHIK